MQEDFMSARLDNELWNESVRQKLLSGVGTGASLLLARPRSALTIALGGTVLLSRFLQDSVGRAAEEGERQLSSLSTSFAELGGGFWRRPTHS